MSHLTQSMVEQFFELEKESARGVLRKEMDSAMDTIFGQMKRKLMQLVDTVETGNEICDGQGDLGNRVHYEQPYTSSNQIPSTISQAMSCYLNASNLFQHGCLGDRIHYEQVNSNSNQIRSTSINSHAPANTSNLFHDDEVIVKSELDEIVNTIPNEPIPSSSTRPSNEQSNDNDDDLFDEFDEEDCDCPDCVGDLFVVKEEGYDQDEEDDDDVQLIDESNESNPRPTKRARLDHYLTRHPNQHSNQDTRVIAVSFKCRQCSAIFENKHQLKVHLKSVHSIGLYRCLYRDCNQTMDHNQLAHHYNTSHSNNFHCEHCSTQFKNLKVLRRHYSRKHQEGIFQCAQPNCDFTAEFSHLVVNHVNQSHKSITKTVACNYPGCVKMFVSACELTIHQRAHRGVKPFRCRWPDCSFGGSAKKSNTIKHIRLKHLEPSQLDVDAQAYLGVIEDLL